MADTLPSIAPSYPLNDQTSLRTRQAQFGDGYSQRAADGLNSTPKVLNLVFQARPNADITTIYDFLVDKLGFEAFLFTAPNDTERKWICKEPISRDPVSTGHSTLKCVFEEVLDL